MPSFSQLRDGTIRIMTSQATYDMSKADFEKAFDMAAPQLPQGINQRIYQPGVRHPLNKDDNTMDGGPMPWPLGDAIIARADQVMADIKAKETQFNTTLDMGGTINQILT